MMACRAMEDRVGGRCGGKVNIGIEGIRDWWIGNSCA